MLRVQTIVSIAISSLLLVLGASAAHAGRVQSSAFQSSQTLYVSASGVDTNDGLAVDRPVRQIQRAVDLAGAGATIQVGAGTYEPFTIANKSDLRVSGATGMVITDNRYDRLAGILVRDSQRIVLEDFAVSQTLWGLVVEHSDGVTIQRAQINDVGQEGMLIGKYSSDILIADSQIHATGMRGGVFAGYGEGVYIGTGSGLTDDDTHNVRILRNNIYNTTSEAIDIKQSVYDVLIEGNYVHDLDTNTSGAVVVGVGTRAYRDPQVRIRGNIIWNISANTPWVDGNAISLSAAATVEANVIWGTEHHGVLLDGNFVSSNKLVQLTSNAIFQSGRDPIGQWLTPNPGTQQLSNNLTPSEVESFLGQTPAASATSPGAAAVSLRNALMAALSGGSTPVTSAPPAPATASTTTTIGQTPSTAQTQSPATSPAGQAPPNSSSSTTISVAPSQTTTSTAGPAGTSKSSLNSTTSTTIALAQEADQISGSTSSLTTGQSTTSTLQPENKIGDPGTELSPKDLADDNDSTTPPSTANDSDDLDQQAPAALALVEVDEQTKRHGLLVPAGLTATLTTGFVLVRTVRMKRIKTR